MAGGPTIAMLLEDLFLECLRILSAVMASRKVIYCRNFGMTTSIEQYIFNVVRVATRSNKGMQKL